MSFRVTVYDIAERLQLSVSTVSRVLNNSTLISSEKRALILETAREMGYQKRTIRRQRGRRVLNVLLFLPYAPSGYLHLFYDPAELVASIEEGFGGVRANIIAQLNRAGRPLFDHKKLGDIDACIFGFTSPLPSLLEQIEERGIPLVLINRTSATRNFVSCDHAAGMSRLLDEVRQKKEARGERVLPCYLGFAPIRAVSDARRDGVFAAARAAGVPFGAQDVWELAGIESVNERLLEQIVSGGYNALFCFNDVVAVYVLQVARQIGIRIPEDLSLTGFDNSPVRQVSVPPLTTINLSTRELGAAAGSWLRRCVIERAEEPLQLEIAGEYIEGLTV